MIQFDEMGLRPEILSAIAEMGFAKPTPVQEKVIPYLTGENQDLVALAQTGTGKTAAYGLPIIQQIDPKLKIVQALILSPTRELALQIAGDFENFSKHLHHINIAVVYGGADIRKQMNEIERGAQIIVGTPGRTLDIIKRRKLDIGSIRWLVLEEADEMLSMGFKDDLDAILENSPSEKQTLLFSATMPDEIARISKKYMNNPSEISVGKKNIGAENVEHHFYLVHAKDRYLALKRVADINPNIYGIIFCRTRMETKEIADKLMHDGYNADALHGDLSQAQRDFVMARFRAKHLRILVATDVAARGLDVNDLTHVINYNLPDDPEIYIHRSGRTGRAGKKGISVTFIHLKEKSKLRQVEKILNKQFIQKPVPSGREICERQLFSLIDKVEKIEVNESQIDSFMPVIYKKLAWLEWEELVKRFVSVEFNRFLTYYENAQDINVNESLHHESYEQERSGKRRGRDRGEERRDDRFNDRDRNRQNERGRKGIAFSRFFFNLGKKDGITKRTIIDMVNENMPGKSVEIGNIEILRNFSFFELDKRFEKEVLKSFAKAQFKGQRIGIDLAKAK
jgi:ATP-dependent RNA helicase DeaD